MEYFWNRIYFDTVLLETHLSTLIEIFVIDQHAFTFVHALQTLTKKNYLLLYITSSVKKMLLFSISSFPVYLLLHITSHLEHFVEKMILATVVISKCVHPSIYKPRVHVINSINHAILINHISSRKAHNLLATIEGLKS